MRICALPQKDTWLLSKYHGTIRRRDACDAVAQVPFKLVNIIGTLTATPCELTVYRINLESTGAYTQNQRVLLE